MASLDIVSLYTNIPVDKAIQNLEDVLSKITTPLKLSKKKIINSSSYAQPPATSRSKTRLTPKLEGSQWDHHLVECWLAFSWRS